MKISLPPPALEVTTHSTSPDGAHAGASVSASAGASVFTLATGVSAGASSFAPHALRTIAQAINIANTLFFILLLLLLFFLTLLSPEALESK